MQFPIKMLLLAALCTGWAQPAWALGVEAAVNLWAPEASGSFGYQPVAAGDGFDLEHDGGLGRENNWGGRIKVDLPILPDILFQATPMAFSGTGSKGDTFSFGGHTYTANTALNAKLGLNHYDLGLIFGVPLLETATLKTLNIDFGLVVRRQEIRAELAQPATGQFVRVDETYYLPMGYLAAQVRVLNKLALEAELRGLAYSDNHYYDLVGRIRFYLPGPVFVAGGWRYQEIELDEDGIRASVKFSGPFAEVGVGF
jgi:outer membrane protein